MFFDQHLQFYMPCEEVFTKDHLKAVLKGDKQLLKKAEVKYITVPMYEELSVKAIYPLMQKDPDFCSYFPSKYPVGKGPPREYFFNILNTLQPEYLGELMAFANKQRMTGEGEDRKNETIKISEFWAEQLQAMPYLSRKWLL